MIPKKRKTPLEVDQLALIIFTEKKQIPVLVPSGKQINPNYWDVHLGASLHSKLRGIKGVDTGISDPEIKRQISEQVQEFASRSIPQGASKSMSPYLLANSFQVDFYQLYKAVQADKERKGKEKKIEKFKKEVADIEKRISRGRPEEGDKKILKNKQAEILKLETELIEAEVNKKEQEDEQDKFLRHGLDLKMKAKITEEELSKPLELFDEPEIIVEEPEPQEVVVVPGKKISLAEKLRLKKIEKLKQEGKYIEQTIEQVQVTPAEQVKIDKEKFMLDQIDKQLKMLKKKGKPGDQNSPQLENEPLIDLSMFKSQKQREKDQKEKERHEKRELLRQIHALKHKEVSNTRSNFGLSIYNKSEGSIASQSLYKSKLGVGEQNSDDAASQRLNSPGGTITDMNSQSFGESIDPKAQKAKLLAELERKRKEKIKMNHKIEKKRDLTEEFSMNFYGRGDAEEGTRNEKLDDIKDEAERKKRMLGMMGQEYMFKDMMKNINSSNKRFLDAIRFKITQELRDFKRSHEKTVKQLACSTRKQKPIDMTLQGGASAGKETRQNQRILDDMIQEATKFDNRLKKLGMEIKIDELIKADKDGKHTSGYFFFRSRQ